MEQHDGHGVIGSGLKPYFALRRNSTRRARTAVDIARFASRASASAATSDECDGTVFALVGLTTGRRVPPSLFFLDLVQWKDWYVCLPWKE